MRAKYVWALVSFLLITSLSLSTTTVAAQGLWRIEIVAGQGRLTSTVDAFPEHDGTNIPLETEGHRCYLWISAQQREISDSTRGSGVWVDVDHDGGVLTILFTVNDIDFTDYPWFFIHGTAEAFINDEFQGEYGVFFEGDDEVDIRIYLYPEGGGWSEPWENCWYYAGGHGLEIGKIMTVAKP